LDIGEILGLLAGLFTTLAAIPQIIKIFKYKSAVDISLIYVSMFLIGGGLWLAYGIVDRLMPIIFWNILGLSLNIAILIGKLKYSKNRRNGGNWAVNEK
jgi:MtN3 and saliva related transmembrane protein